jgi:hypothetical protein
MGLRRLLPPLWLLALACRGGVPAGPRPDWVLLFDFRYNEPKAPPLALGPGELDGLLSAARSLAPPDAAECPPEAPRLPAGLVGYDRGAFTKPGAEEDLFLLDLGCGGATRLVVYAKGAPLLALAPGAGRAFLRALDIDGDGDKELLFATRAGEAGVARGSAELVSLAGGRIAPLRGFEGVAFDSCAAGDASGGILADMVFYRVSARGEAPEFQAVSYQAECPPGGRTPQFKMLPARP